MGLSELHAKHALYNSGGKDADLAVTWYFTNTDHPDLNKPLLVKKSKPGNANAADAGGPPQDLIDQMVMMGLPPKKSKKALKNCDNNLERALDWAFSHMGEVDSDSDQPAADGDGDSQMIVEDLNK